MMDQATKRLFRFSLEFENVTRGERDPQGWIGVLASSGGLRSLYVYTSQHNRKND